MNAQRMRWLVGLLVLQVVLAVGLYVNDAGFRAPQKAPLLAFDTEAIDAVRIEEPGASANGTLQLVRAGESWTLAPVDGEAEGETKAADGDRNVPADGAKIDETLNKLAGLTAPWPVATSGAARERFEVADDKFQRRITLSADGQPVAALLLGTSPGFRRLHARVPDTDAVYEVDLAHFDLSTNADDWVDRAVLAAVGEVTSVAREGVWRIARSDDGWMLDDGAADAAKAAEMAARLANLRVLGAAARPAGEPTDVFVVTDDQGAHRLSVFPMEGGPDVVVTSDRRPGAYRLASFIVEQVRVDAGALLPAAEPSSEGAAEPAPAVGGPPE
jgi:hypothetical protein